MDHVLDESSLSYQLYLKSQRFLWKVSDVDLTEDARQWPTLTPGQRQTVLATLFAFGVGEETVARSLAPLVLVLDAVEDQMYLTAQMFEEAKHAEMMDRYWRDVIVPHEGGRPMSAVFEGAIPGESLRFYARFFEALEAQMRSVLDDQSPENIARAIMHYHVALEGGVSQREFVMVSRTLEQWQRLPGLHELFTYLRNDEGRHFMFGLGVLKRMIQVRPALYQVVHEAGVRVLRAVLRDGDRFDVRLRGPLTQTREELFDVLAREFAERLAYLRGRPVTRRFLLAVKGRLLERAGRPRPVQVTV